MTPIINAAPNSPEEKYTKAHCSVRNRIERYFGVLKSRFRCLSKQRVLHYSPKKASKFVIVCSILHNFYIDFRVNPVINNDEEHVDIVNGVQVNQIYDIPAAPGRRAREQIVQNYFAH